MKALLLAAILGGSGSGSGIIHQADSGYSKSAFGEIRVVNPTPVVQMLTQYNLIGDELEVFTATGGSVTASNGEFCAMSGTSLGGYGVVRSRRPVVYKPGAGITSRFTARFPTNVALSTTRAGPFNATDALQFGYNGTEFGTLYEHHGVLEIQELQITAAASGTESLTVTINGTGHTFNVTGTTIADNVFEIAEELSDNVAGWYYDPIGDTVYVQYQTTADATGAFSFVNNTGGGTAAGSFSEAIAGAAKTTEWTAQADWNIDKAAWLDPSKGNVYQVSIPYLGYGGFLYSIKDPATGDFVPVHRRRYENTASQPTVSNPSFKVGWVAASLGSTGTDVSAHGASAAAFVDGARDPYRPSRAIENTKSIGTTETVIQCIRVRRTLNNKSVVGEAVPVLVGAATESTKNTIVDVYLNPVTAGTPNYSFVDETNSIVIEDTSSTTYTSGGTEVGSILLAGNSSGAIDTSKRGVYLLPGDRLCVTGVVTSGSSSNITSSIAWEEDF